MPEWGTILTASLSVVAGIVWLVRLEGRVNLTAAAVRDLKDDLTEIKRDIKELLRHS